MGTVSEMAAGIWLDPGGTIVVPGIIIRCYRSCKHIPEYRSITVNFHDEATYHRLREDGRAFVEIVLVPQKTQISFQDIG